MADNYLEKRYEETLGSQRPKVKRVGPNLDQLLVRARSCRVYNKNYRVSRAELERIVGACTKIGSAKNQQVLRFRLVTQGPEADLINANIKLGGLLPELHLPLPGTEPEAFIVACTNATANNYTYIDLGMALQTMMLKISEMGLSGLIIGAFNKTEIKAGLNLNHEPLMVLAVGKGAEQFQLVPVAEGHDLAYYREGGTHYVPKLSATDLIINS